MPGKPDAYEGAGGERYPTVRAAVIDIFRSSFGPIRGDLVISGEQVIRPRTHRFLVTWGGWRHRAVDIVGLWDNDEQEEWGCDDDGDDFPF